MNTEIQATGAADAAVRAAQKAQEYEDRHKFVEAIQLNEKASMLYLQAGAELAQGNLGYDRAAMASFTQLSNSHTRKVKFLNLRLKDPKALYDVDAIRRRLHPKKEKLQE